MKPPAIQRRFGRITRFHLLGQRGFVSDDTEQSALMVQSLLRGGDEAGVVRHFRRALLGWFWRLPYGIGWSTLKAGWRLTFGLARSGVPSAGNGAAMRAGALGVALAQSSARHQWGRALAQVTHTDPCGVEGALFVAEVAAGLASVSVEAPSAHQAVVAGRALVEAPVLADAIDQAIRLVESGADCALAAAELGNTGYVVHTLGLATFALLWAERERADFEVALAEVIGVGGDTDTIGAIVGAWLGAWWGPEALPAHLIKRLQGGPFGPAHLRALARAVAQGRSAPRYSAARALLRNLALYPVILGHGFRRLLP